MDRLGVWADRRIGEKAATPTPVPPKPTCSPSAGAIADLPFRRSVHTPTHDPRFIAVFRNSVSQLRTGSHPARSFCGISEAQWSRR